ncbi:MAG: cytochrome c biogenesis protein CcsA [Nitrospirae bacterium]|nr:cytochrome c biogenesis protein CcsA [Nitrospirota bacterium]
MLLLALSFGAYLFSLVKKPFLYIGLILQTAYIISRGFSLGRLPLVGPHDTIAFLSASLIAFSIPFSVILKKQPLFHNGLAITASAFTVFSLISKQNNAPLPPVLKTLWFESHVVLAFLSYALFGIAAILGYFYLREKDDNAEGLQYRAILIGYCLFTLSIVFGGVWAYLAWGTYWLWTPKELWTSILWLFYGLHLHARLRQWWTDRMLAYLGIAGFAVVLFTYLGVSLLMKSSHSF